MWPQTTSFTHWPLLFLPVKNKEQYIPSSVARNKLHIGHFSLKTVHFKKCVSNKKMQIAEKKNYT